mgnify:CR=1 FL=1
MKTTKQCGNRKSKLFWRIVVAAFVFLSLVLPEARSYITSQDRVSSDTSWIMKSLSSIAFIALNSVSPHSAFATSAPDPPNLHELECKFHALAYQFGIQRVADAAENLHAALNLDNCTDVLSKFRKVRGLERRANKQEDVLVVADTYM